MAVSDDKIIKRSTTLRFYNANSMVNAFRDVCSVTIRREVCEVNYHWKKHRYLGWEAKEILIELGYEDEIIVERNWYNQHSWQAKDEIKKVLELPADTYLEWSGLALTLTTYNLSEDQHKTEMRKLYCPMIKKGYNVSHSCQTVVTNANC